MQTYSNYIQGKFDENGKRFVIKDKFSGEPLGDVCLASESSINTAFEFADANKGIAKKLSAGKREKILSELATILENEADEFAKLIAGEAGKPFEYARGEVARSVRTLRFASEEARRLRGEVIPMDFDGGVGKKAFTLRDPIGVISGITPYNFPLNLALHKIAPAIASGNPIVIKPSPHAPLSLLKFANILDRTSLPKGLVQILICADEDAKVFSTHPAIKLVSFTGSEQVGWQIKEAAKEKKVILELGGNAGIYIDDSSDYKKWISQICQGAFLYAGQICISTQRIYVQKSIFDQFLLEFKSEVEKLTVGNPMEPGVSVGPLISSAQLERVKESVESAISVGAKLITGGKILDERANLYAPTILSSTNSEMDVWAKEIFGPVVIVESVQDLEDGITKINDSNYGLQSSVFTNRLDQFQAAIDGLESGAVLFNHIPGFRLDHMPYGGIKRSGFGREGLIYAIEEMTEPKLIIL